MAIAIHLVAQYPLYLFIALPIADALFHGASDAMGSSSGYDTPRRLAGVCAYQAEAGPKEIQGVSEARGDAVPLPPALHGKLDRARH